MPEEPTTPPSSPTPTPGGTPAPGGTPVVRLAAKVAHELNNPLDAVLRLVSLAQRKAKSGDYADLDRHLSDAQFGLQRMAEILRELMDVGRQSEEAGAQGAQLLSLEELIALATRTIALQAEQRHVAIDVACDLPPAPAAGYDARLSQVLANLLKNALDAAPENSAVHVAAVLEAGQLKITVRDTGAGIDPALLPRLFTPFVTTKPRGKGNGLGLAISRDLVMALGGTLTIDNATGGGCVSTILLPHA